ncbi:MAG: alanine racemase [Pyrinomonadaceae bacterium]
MDTKLPQRPTTAIVDLDTLAANFRSTKEFVGSDLAYMAVVKANAYGHGAVECARRLAIEGVDWFGVAIPEEGVELRKAGISLPILCLGSFWPGQERLLAEYDLTPVIYSLDAARSLDSIGHNFDIHVKIDTGMGRVGIPYQSAEEFARDLLDLPNLKVTGLLTHFAAAEDRGQDDFTFSQMERFNIACKTFESAGHNPEYFDLANSPGAITHPEARGNLVRLGGALYGLLDDILPANSKMPELRPVLSLSSRIALIRHVPAGESLGYGRSFVTRRDSRIALVPIGYADGYPRILSNIGNAVIEGQSAPIVGKISMDWTLFDVTDIGEAAVDSQVTLIGDGTTAADLAGKCGTIGYEITCGLTSRVPRVYIGDESN